jgi:hypothetical protein
MRNGFLAFLMLFAFVAPQAWAQAPSFVPGLDAPWQPPELDLDQRPNVGPRGYPVYGRVDYLLWWTEKDRPVTSLSAGQLAPAANALLPAATDFGPLLRNGERNVLGAWLDQQQRFGLEAGVFWVLDRSPTGGGGIGDVALQTQLLNRLWGAEAQFRGEVYRGTWAHVDFLGGFRFLSLDEALRIDQRNGTAFTSDRFGTHNRFYGGQLGAEVELHRNKLFADIWGKAALGTSCQELNFNGAAGRDAIAVLPEFGFNLGYHLTSNIRLTAGYTFFYISDVARPGDQAPLRPGPLPVHGGEFWGQGLNFGFEFRF